MNFRFEKRNKAYKNLSTVNIKKSEKQLFWKQDLVFVHFIVQCQVLINMQINNTLF